VPATLPPAAAASDGTPDYRGAVLLAPHPDGHVAVHQPTHGWMCGQLGRAWGNELLGRVEPAEEVCLAAEQHDTSWAEWELAPTLDPATGLPHTFDTAPFTVHLGIHTAWPPKLATQSRYAALLVSMHHRSFFEAPGRLGRLRPAGRQIERYLAWHDEFQAGLRRTLDATDAELDRNRRLVRTWDGLSHDLILAQAPRTRRNVPAAGAASLDVRIDRDGDAFTIDPWPFTDDRVVVRVEGKLLTEAFADEEPMRAALAAAPWLELRYELKPART
jgi:hypothetical protein